MTICVRILISFAGFVAPDGGQGPDSPLKQPGLPIVGVKFEPVQRLGREQLIGDDDPAVIGKKFN